MSSFLEPNLELLYRQGGPLTRVLNPRPGLYGEPPAILLINPKYPHNVGGVVRAASCYGVEQVWFTGNRVSLEEPRDHRAVRTAAVGATHLKFRLPREERMRGYRDVRLFQNDRPFDQFTRCTPVAVELREKSESLIDFEHPADALYVFGPEDSSLERVVLQHCHRFVVIPTRHCLNLAAAVYTVLYDRALKEYR